MRPLRFDISGTTDANGNLTVTVPLAGSGEHRIVKVTGSLATGGEWALIASGSLLTFGRGRRVTLGPELLEPQDTLKVQITGALPNTAMIGSVTGLEGSFEEVLRQFSPQPNTIALDVNAPPILLVETPTGLNNLPAPLTKALPVGAVAVGYVPVVNPGGSIANVTAISIVGSQTGITYVLDTANFPTTPVAVLLDPSDTSVVCNVQAAGARPAVDFLCWTVPTAVQISNRSGAPLFVDVTDRLARLVGRVVIRDTFGNEPSIAAGSLQVQEGTLPPAWQAPNQAPVAIGAVINAGATLNLVAAVGGQTVRLFNCPLAVDAVLATGTINLEDTGNTVRHQFSTSTSPCNPFSSAAGVALPIGLGVQLHNPAGSAQTVRGSLVYSQN